METIHILHTNDLHSHFENWPRMRRFLLEHQAAPLLKDDACAHHRRHQSQGIVPPATYQS